MEWLRRMFIALSIGGVILSTLGYGAVHFTRDYLEEGARDTVATRTEQKVRELVTPLPVEGEGAFAALRNSLVEKATAALRHALGEDYPDRLRRRIDELCVCRMSAGDVATVLSNYDDAKSEVERVIDAALAGNFADAKLAPGTFRALVDGYYVDTVEGLVRDLRIFFGLNILLYLMAGAITWFGGASRKVITPVGLLLVSNIAAGYGYVFNTNWLATIVLNAWTGYGYLVIVGILFAFYSYKLWVIKVRIRVARAIPSGRA